MLKIVSAAIRRLHRVTEIEMQKKLSKYLAESDDREGHWNDDWLTMAQQQQLTVQQK